MHKWRIGIDNGNSLVTEELVELILERGFPYESIALYGSSEELGDALELGEDLSFPISPRSQGVENPPDILFITNEADGDNPPINARLVISAKEEVNPKDPMVIPEVNVEAIHDGIHAGRILVPSPVATAVATALTPLHQELELTSLQLTTMEPMSVWGRAGLDMFTEQVSKLLNGIEPEGHEQLAFNVLPFVGPMLPKNPLGSVAVSEMLLAKELDRFFPQAKIRAIRCNIPVFYGLGVLMQADFNQDVDLDKARELLRTAPGLMLINEDEREPVALREVVGSDCTVVGRLQKDPNNNKSLLIWAALDNLRKGAATSMVEIAEIAIRDYGPHLEEH